MTAAHYIFALKLIPGIGDVSLLKISDAVRNGASWETVLAEPRRFLKGSKAASAVEAIQTDFSTYAKEAEEKLSRYGEQGVSVCCMLDEVYPEKLFELKDPPVLLFTRGDLSVLTSMKGVAVVGARESTAFGEKVAGTLSVALSRRGYNVVSGLAVGIDTAAHRGVLAANGTTTAVVVDVAGIYPSDNVGLAEEIVESGGLLIAEHPPGTSAIGRRLTDRDRIQSILSIAVFPIEAGHKGGTMYTVRYAREQRRPLFCIEPSELDAHARSDYAEVIAGIVREGAAVYRTNNIDRVVAGLGEYQRNGIEKAGTF